MNLPKISDVFHACMSERGEQFRARGRRAVCPFHGGSSFSLSFSDDNGFWKCFHGACPNPSGGVLAVPIAFGYASNKTEASHWLAKRRIIAAPEKQAQTYDKVVAFKKKRQTFVDPKNLTDEQRDVWRNAQLDLAEAIGWQAWQAYLKESSELRVEEYASRTRRIEKRANTLERLWLEEQKWVANGSQGKGPGTVERMRLLRTRPDLYTGPEWFYLKRFLPKNHPAVSFQLRHTNTAPIEAESGAIGSPNTWAESGWDNLARECSEYIDTKLSETVTREQKAA